MLSVCGLDSNLPLFRFEMGEPMDVDETVKKTNLVAADAQMEQDLNGLVVSCLDSFICLSCAFGYN